MGIEARAALAILGMALVTFAARAGGVWLTARGRPTPRVEAGLRAVPGAVLVALVLPAALEAGTAGVAAVAVATLVALRTGGVLAPMAAGMATAALLRLALS